MKNKENVGAIIWETVKKRKWRALGIIGAVLGAIIMALLPPLILGNVIDTMTAGMAVPFYMILLYFGFTALTGLTESIREGLLIGFGQKITHALRAGLMDKYTRLTADELTKQEPSGTGNARLKVCRGCGHSREPVYIRHCQHVCRCL